MNKKHIADIEKLKLKVGCETENCGQYFTFNVTEHALTVKNDRKKIYVGSCSKCHKVLKLTEKGLKTFKAAYGETNIAVIKPKFDDIFEEV